MRRPDGPVSAVFFDGETATRHDVLVTVNWQSPPTLDIAGDAAGLPLCWPLGGLRGLSDQSNRETLVVTRLAATEDETPRDPARLVISDPTLRDWIRQSRPNLHRKDVFKGTALKVLGRGTAALVAFALILFVILPRLADTLAVLIPPEREAALGAATIRQFELIFGDEDGGSMRCDNADAQAVWDRMATRMAANGGYNGPLALIVLDHPMVNAFAAPGGHVVFFKGMIDAAETPDELAAVLAHEIGHVAARDPTRLALRSVGTLGILGLIFGDFTGGGAVLLIIEQLIDANYSREAEAAADLYAFEALTAANINAAALGDLFARLRDEYGDTEGLIAHFVGHPSLGDRIAAARAVGAGLSDPRPVISSAEFDMIKATCD